MSELACSDEMKRYFQSLFRETDRCYDIATRAREVGYDPEMFVEIPQAEDLAARVEKQLSDFHVEGVAEIIRDLSSKHESREEVSLLVAKEVVKWPSKNREESIDRAVRVGLSVLTEGILVAPIVGIGNIKVGKNSDGSEYVSLFFNGPIRSAGGTGQAMSVLIADIVRREFGIGKYKPEHGEIERLKEEIPLYKRCQHLQYLPTNDEIDLIYKNCPVCVDGEKTEDLEITGFRNLPRIKTNCVRGGVCLVLAEGLCQKAPKIEKHVKKLGIDGWEFISEYVKKKKGTGGDKDTKTVKPSYKYLEDIVAGRPAFSHPSKAGGLRLRYGRARTTGLAALAINPTTMFAVDSFLAIGTQIKIERPGKAGAVTPCTEIEGPIILLDDNSMVQCNTVKEFAAVKSRMVEIVDLGEVLLPYGEFSENNHVLVQGDFSIEWYKQELLEATKWELPEDWKDPSYDRAFEMSKTYGVPFHPKFNLFWSDIPLDELKALRAEVMKTGHVKEGQLFITLDPASKRTLENLGALHQFASGESILDHYARPLLAGFGLTSKDDKVVEVAPFEGATSLEAVSGAMSIPMRQRAVTRIGTRMARPEKAKERRMKPPPHVLFPIGKNGGPQRLLDKAMESGTIKVQMGIRTCPECDSSTISCRCECGHHTEVRDQPDEITIPIKMMVEDAVANLGESAALPKIKCVEGLISKTKTPEPLEKGILRRKYDILVNKDGTIRFDMTDVPLTHFKPREIGLSVERAHELGYDKDVHDQPLISEEQVCELKVQDIVPSISCGEYMVSVAKFVDDELTKLYHLPPYYNVKKREDLIGQMTIGLAPHTSGGILCRLIGFTKASVCFGHPFYHAAKRRNADGDEDSVSLLLDCLLNFSRTYLPDSRGGLMDAPLVLAIRLDPNEIDKEAHNIDVLWEYPLEFYKATMEMKHPKDVQASMDIVADRIKSLLQYEGFGYTHDTYDIAEGPDESAYKTLGSMTVKMKAQLRLAKMIRAVDERDVAKRIISKHLLPDLIGNLSSFSSQSVRCTKCGAKYRRVPLRGTCYCGNTLTMTVYEASVKKYLAVAKKVGADFDVPQYVQQRVGIIEESIRSVFGSADTSMDIDFDSLDMIDDSEPEEVVQETTKASTLDSFVTAAEMPKEAQTMSPDDDPELELEPPKPVAPQAKSSKKATCSLDDFF